jgi:hypothetical protein
MDIACFLSWQRVISQFQSGKRTGHLRLLKIDSMRRFENCAARYARGIAQLPATPHPPYMEQIAQREKRNTEDCAGQIKVVADAVLLSPSA